VALCAYGITTAGKRELIDFLLVKAEAEDTWYSFLWNLWSRGLRGALLDLIVTDGQAGLVKALSRLWPAVAHQRCWAHKLRNLENKLKASQGSCLEEAKLTAWRFDRQRRQPDCNGVESVWSPPQIHAREVGANGVSWLPVWGGVASRFVCKSFEGFLGPVGIHAIKDAVEDAFTTVSGSKSTHGADAPTYFHKEPFNHVGST